MTALVHPYQLHGRNAANPRKQRGRLVAMAKPLDAALRHLGFVTRLEFVEWALSRPSGKRGKFHRKSVRDRIFNNRHLPRDFVSPAPYGDRSEGPSAGRVGRKSIRTGCTRRDIS